jgi:hypothetical protein
VAAATAATTIHSVTVKAIHRDGADWSQSHPFIVTVLETLRASTTGFPKQRLQVVHLEGFVQHVVDAQVERAFHYFWRAESRHENDRAVG